MQSIFRSFNYYCHCCCPQRMRTKTQIYIISSHLARHRADSIARNGSHRNSIVSQSMKQFSSREKTHWCTCLADLFLLLKYLLCNWTPSAPLRAPSETRWLIWKYVFEKITKVMWRLLMRPIRGYLSQKNFYSSFLLSRRKWAVWRHIILLAPKHHQVEW